MAVFVAVLSYALLGVPSAAVAMGFLASVAPVSRSVRQAEKVQADLRERWPDLLMYTRTAVSAGSTLADAVLDAMRKVGGPFTDIAHDLAQEIGFGTGFGGGLRQIRLAHSDPTTDRVIATLETADRTGGARVGESLAVLGASVSDELRLRKAHDAALTEQRWTVNVALVSPWVLLALAIATNPHAKLAFSTGEGTVVVAIGLIATVSGWLVARRTARLSRPPEVFR
ncbi:MAG: type II secretion system F family protein [Acidimicrobiia bacterium]